MEGKPTVFLVEHMEEFLYEWCKYEYIQMLEYLQDTGVRLCFSNFRVVQEYTGKFAVENVKYLEELRQAFKQYSNAGRLLTETYGELLGKNSGKLVIPDVGEYDLREICLLDMRGKEVLGHGDAGHLKVFLFGGILGDHPPRDRTKLLRHQTETLRHLGTLQLSTDTAVLTAKLILLNGMQLETIPFVQEPEIVGPNKQGQKNVIQMEGFRYINKRLLDFKTGKPPATLQSSDQPKKAKTDQLYISDGVRRLLLEDELDVAMFM